MVIEPRLYTVSELAKLSRLHERTLRGKIAAGTIAVVRIPGMRLIRIGPDEVRRLLGLKPKGPRRPFVTRG